MKDLDLHSVGEIKHVRFHPITGEMIPMRIVRLQRELDKDRDSLYKEPAALEAKLRGQISNCIDDIRRAGYEPDASSLELPATRIELMESVASLKEEVARLEEVVRAARSTQCQ